jgi:Mg-chelatase subunit ChlD
MNERIPHMNHDTATPVLDLTTLWERDAVFRDGDETALVVRIRAADSTPRNAGRAPLDIAFALDRSGSMHGADKIDLVKERRDRRDAPSHRR